MNESFSKKIAKPVTKYSIKPNKVPRSKLISAIVSAFLCFFVGLIGIVASFSNNNITAKATEVKLLSINTNESQISSTLLTNEDLSDQKPEAKLETDPKLENKTENKLADKTTDKKPKRTTKPKTR